MSVLEGCVVTLIVGAVLCGIGSAVISGQECTVWRADNVYCKGDYQCELKLRPSKPWNCSPFAHGDVK